MYNHNTDPQEHLYTEDRSFASTDGFPQNGNGIYNGKVYYPRLRDSEEEIPDENEVDEPEDEG